MTDLWEIEKSIACEGIRPVCGVDEAGRGPLAGPVCAAAVVLPLGHEIPGLNDSKKLSAKKRDELYDIIVSEAVGFSVAYATVEEIEQYNILGATYLAMNRAIEQLGFEVALALIDGNRCEGIAYPCRTVVGGDGKCAGIAAASILAKVSRDRLMEEYDRRYPEYGFTKHKGYGTKAHYAALREHGPCPCHRLSFLKKVLHREDENAD